LPVIRRISPPPPHVEQFVPNCGLAYGRGSLTVGPTRGSRRSAGVTKFVTRTSFSRAFWRRRPANPTRSRPKRTRASRSFCRRTSWRGPKRKSANSGR